MTTRKWWLDSGEDVFGRRAGKASRVWASITTAVAAAVGNFLLLENGDPLLLETGDELLLES